MKFLVIYTFITSNVCLLQMKRTYKSGSAKRKDAKKTKDASIAHTPKLTSFFSQPTITASEVKYQSNSSDSNDYHPSQPNISTLNETAENNTTSVLKSVEYVVCASPPLVENNIEHHLESLSDDPAEWPEKISHNQRYGIVERGPPIQTGREFPFNNANRRFTKMHYFRKMENGESIKRSWLLYSPKNDAIFCFCCRLFGSGDIPLRHGTSTWEGLSKKLKDHETGKSHQDCVMKWMDLRKSITNQKQ